MSLALAALRRVSFDWTAHIGEIWSDQRHETESLQGEIRKELAVSLDDLREQRHDSSPLGVSLLGPAGSGKTHLLGFVRRQSLARGAYFILADMTDVADFWDTVLLGYLRSLQQPLADGRRQVDHWLERMIERFGQSVRRAEIPKQRPPGLINRIEELMADLRAKHRADVQEHADVLRALVLFSCDHADVNDLGYKWLQGVTIDAEELGIFGFRQHHQKPSSIVKGISWLLSLTAPTVLALDQLDAIVAEHELSRGDAESDNASEQQRRSLAIIQSIASGLRDLRDITRRTLTVVSSLETTWHILHHQATVSMADRYDEPLLLRPATGPLAVRELIVGRLQPAYEAVGFVPPYPSYPFTEKFLEEYRHNTPREVLKACEAHRKLCRRTEKVRETNRDTSPPPPPPPPDWKLIEERVAQLAASFNFDALLAEDAETEQDRLIEAACESLVLENSVPTTVSPIVDKDFMGTGNYDPLHARVRLVLTDQGERELHHSFRFLQNSHYRAFQARLKAALTASGIDQNLAFRGLSILRIGPVPSGPASEKLLEELRTRGGSLLEPTREEVATLFAISQLLHAKDEPARFEQWLAETRPISSLPTFRSAVASLFGGLSSPPMKVIPEPAKAGTVPTPVVAPPSVLPIGRRLTSGELAEEVGIPLHLLPYHTCVFAGSGSGKTVFLKRVIEEAALLGIPSIVLDGANDLCRLGEAWPKRPEEFSDEDVNKSERYRERAEVVVWTPGAASGNPMRLNPLPDFTSQAATPAEREADLATAIEVAASSVGDLIIRGHGGTAGKQTAILKSTLRHFARRGGTIRDLAALLQEPPDEAIDKFEKGDKLARELSEQLYAVIENDPLIGGTGAPLDPALLFRASAPGKTRVSVLSLVGLPGYDEKRRFVDQLASSLFSYIKKTPAPPGGLLGLLVIDEARDYVPSGRSVPGKENVRRLAAQARKYGLGLLFATQEPKSIENSIVSNCSTLLGGKMSSPAAISGLEQLLSDKGANATDVAKLTRGTFYFGSGPEKPRKISTSLCLSYHPSTPPSEAQVLELARGSVRSG
jgi:DNA helicase HerA-like ATPase